MSEKHHEHVGHESHGHHEHKAEHENKGHSGKGSISEKNKMLAYGIGLLIIGILIGAVVSYGFNLSAGNTLVNTTDSLGDAAEIKSVLINQINATLPADYKQQGVYAIVYDANGIVGGFYTFKLYLTDGTQEQFAGTAYANSKVFLLGNDATDLNRNSPAFVKPIKQVVPITVTPAEKANGELYIFSYCPAGTQALDSFAKAGALLKDVADVKVKFFSNMHGAHEKQQNITQECIQDVAPAKYWDYANQFVAKIYNVCGSTASVDCDKTESIKLMDLVGIDSNAVINCVATKGEALYAADQADAIALQLQYSPSVVINGTYLGNADRTPEGLKTAICAGFITQPAVCSQSLGTAAVAATGSCS